MGFKGKALNLILNCIEFRSHHEPYVVHDILQRNATLGNNLPTSLKDWEAKEQFVETRIASLPQPQG